MLVESSEKEVSSIELGPPSCSINTQKPQENETSSTSLLKLSLLGYSIVADQEAEYKLPDDNLSEIEEKGYKTGSPPAFSDYSVGSPSDNHNCKMSEDSKAAQNP